MASTNLRRIIWLRRVGRRTSSYRKSVSTSGKKPKNSSKSASTFSLSTSTEFLAIGNSRRQLSPDYHRRLGALVWTPNGRIRGSFGSSPFLGATCRPPPPLRSSRLVRTDFSPVLIYMRAARAHGFLPSKVSVHGGSNDCIRAFSPEKPCHFSSQPLFWQGTAAFWLAAVSAQNPHQKKIICGRRNIRTSFCPLVIVEGHSRWTPCSGRAHRLRNRSPRFIRAR